MTDLIFGYTWDQIQRAQQKKEWKGYIKGSFKKPTATEQDYRLLKEKGMKGLEKEQLYGVIDRLKTSAELAGKVQNSSFQTGQQKALNEIQNKAAAVGIKLENISSVYRSSIDSKWEVYDRGSSGGDRYVIHGPGGSFGSTNDLSKAKRHCDKMAESGGKGSPSEVHGI